MKYNPRMRVFIKLDSNGNLTNQIVRQKNKPKSGRWLEVEANVCCTTTTTTVEEV